MRLSNELLAEVCPGVSVLVVEDNPDAADTTAELLALWGSGRPSSGPGRTP